MFNRKTGSGKINHTKVIIDGNTFDSKLEADYYLYLKNKNISSLSLHPAFILQDKFKKNNISYRDIVYKADFMFYDNDEKCLRVIDVKGWETPVFKLKKKMFEFKYPSITLEKVKRVKGKWISY